MRPRRVGNDTFFGARKDLKPLATDQNDALLFQVDVSDGFLAFFYVLGAYVVREPAKEEGEDIEREVPWIVVRSMEPVPGQPHVSFLSENGRSPAK